MPDLSRLRAAYEQARDELLAERTAGGYWVGELSSSALSTATAVSALAVVRNVQSPKSKVQGHDDSLASTLDLGPWTLDSLIARGVTYLTAQQNDDGGFGDTDLSHSNVATTMLVVAALHLAGVADEHADLLAHANAYIDSQGRLAGLRERYGIDKTFVVPIMTNCALAGLVGWREIDPLPFELACVPQSWYRFVGMPVVSYAIPALVAIGQARYFHAPPRNPVTRLIRWLSINRSLKVLRRMQPDSGGYLEATPLTSFVVMSLASLAKPRPVVGVNGEPTLNRPIDQDATLDRVAPRPMAGALNPIAGEVIREGVKFLANSIRPDGSWPIDTNLATWNTTLSINALVGAGEDVAELLGPQCLDWLLSCQHLKRHPFTGADPGGFGWSDLSGAVPDADDTPGAMLALNAWRRSPNSTPTEKKRIDIALLQASEWLLRMRNRDGGWPTFCRGWGKLPFDRSGTDLTAHVLRAHAAIWPDPFGDEAEWLRFPKRRQFPDGSWSPLWFGNQDHPTEDNPVYGTAKVLMAYRDLGLMDSPEAQRGVAWLVANQNEDGGWGSGVWKKRARSAELGARSGVLSTEYSVPCTMPSITSPQPIAPGPLLSSIEETALAVEALLTACPPSPEPRAPSPASSAAEKGLTWLIERVERGEHRQPAPIGFYFAKLWYYERLYPLTFTVAALGRAHRQFSGRPRAADTSSSPTESGTDRQPQRVGSP